MKSHFFASSVYTWMTTGTQLDLRELMKRMDKAGHPYDLFAVPLPPDAPYEIRTFAPQVEGAIWMGTIHPKPKRKRK
jgi:hypothetical protein